MATSKKGPPAAVTRNKLFALSAAAIACSPAMTLVVKRYIFLSCDGSVSPPSCDKDQDGIKDVSGYASLIAGLSGVLGFLMALSWVLFRSYRRRSLWPARCGLAAQAAVPTYLHGGDLFLLQLPFCAAQIGTVFAMAEDNMKAPCAVAGAYGAAVVSVFLFSVLPSRCCCCRGGGSGGWAKEAGRHGRRGELINMLLCGAAAFAFMFVEYDGGFALGFCPDPRQGLSKDMLGGYIMLAVSQFLFVGRNAMARCMIRRNARLLHGVSAELTVAEDDDAEAEDDGAAGDTAGAEATETRLAEPPQAEGELDDDTHLFRGLNEEALTKLDSIFTTPLYLHYPLAVGTLQTFELAQLGGNMMLAPAALIVFFATNTDMSASDVFSKFGELETAAIICCGWLALVAVVQPSLYSMLAQVGSPATLAFLNVLATIIAAMLGSMDAVMPVDVVNATGDTLRLSPMNGVCLVNACSPSSSAADTCHRDCRPVNVSSILNTDNTVTLPEAHSAVAAGMTLQLNDAEGQTCAAAPTASDLIVSSVADAVITFATDIQTGDNDASDNCVLDTSQTHGAGFYSGLSLGPPQYGALCIFALAAAIGLAARSKAASTAASQKQLLYLAEALPNLSSVQMEDLMRVDVTAGHEVFQRLVAESGYSGTVPPTVQPHWTTDQINLNPTLARARELDSQREVRTPAALRLVC